MSRKIDLALFRGDDSDEDIRPAKVELDALKAKTFSYGVTKKTKRDIERELEEKKKREEEEATKLALQEFSREFDNPSSGGAGGRKGRSFVRAGQDREAYVPPRSRDVNTAPRSRDHNAVLTQSPSPPPVPKPRGKRAMDAFLEEMKLNQEAKARAARSGQAANGPVQETTNLCIMNLPEDVTEDTLGRLFAKVGPVGTVKIMWPRGDRGGTGWRRDSMLGFVCYMHRGDAEKALRAFDGYTLGDNTLRVNWSKATPIPSQAAYKKTTSRSASPRNRGRQRSLSPPLGVALPVLSSVEREARRRHWLDQITPDQAAMLEPVLEQVRRDGSNYLNALKEAERKNERFAFLLDDKAPEYHLLQYTIDPEYIFPPPPLPAFNDEGDAACYSSDAAELSEQERTPKVELSPLARRRFEAMLRGLSGKRAEIARAMEFAVKRADAYDTVIEIICQSLCLENTPTSKKIARLYLTSDILHNSASSLPNVWRYRLGLEKRLPDVFEHFAKVHADLLEHSGTITANIFIQQADAVLSAWERWFVFTQETLDMFRKLLHGECTLRSLKEDAERASEAAALAVEKPVVSKSAGFKSSFKPISLVPVAVGRGAVDKDDVDGEPVDDVDGEPVDDVDGEPVDDVDGEVMDDAPEDIDGEGMEDVDGEEMEDVDGEEIDVDGEAM